MHTFPTLPGEKLVEIHHPINCEIVTVAISGEGQLWTMRFECGSTATLPATYVRKCVKTAKASRLRQEGK